MATPPVLQNSDPATAYQRAYDALGTLYWHASDIASKDQIHGAMEAMADIITALDEQDLTANTALFVQLTPKIKAINASLTEISNEIAKITNSIDTAAQVTSALAKAISVFPGL